MLDLVFYTQENISIQGMWENRCIFKIYLFLGFFWYSYVNVYMNK